MQNAFHNFYGFINGNFVRSSCNVNVVLMAQLIYELRLRKQHLAVGN